MDLNQYEIILVNLDPTIGSEIKKTRPCVILSPNEMNKYLHTIIIAPITSTSKNYPTRVEIDVEGKRKWVVIDQIRTIDRQRIIKNKGRINKSEIQSIKSIIRETLLD